MVSQEKIDLLREKLNEADAIIVGGASGMSAASGFEFYYKNDEVFQQLAGKLGEKYNAEGGFPLMYTRGIKKEELWAYYIREFKYLYECYTGESYKELAELLKGKEYYIATTNQDAQFFRTFPAEKITRIQGDFRYWQCKHSCTDEIYPNENRVMELAGKIENDRLPAHLIPRCPHCGSEMIPWWRSYEFLEGSYYQKEMRRYYDYLRSVQYKKVVFLELGVGMMTPMFIKEPFMNMCYQWPDATYVTINPQHAIVPREIGMKSIAIDDDITMTLRRLNHKSIEGMKDFDKSKAFDPGRVY